MTNEYENANEYANEYENVNEKETGKPSPNRTYPFAVKRSTFTIVSVDPDHVNEVSKRLHCFPLDPAVKPRDDQQKKRLQSTCRTGLGQAHFFGE